MQAIAELDRALLDGLGAAGFKLRSGVNGGGVMSLALRRSGGFYIDVGCSQLIVDGEIAVRNSAVDHFTETGVGLEDGCNLDEESELRTIWRDSGHPGFWFMGGSLAMARLFGPALVLQIAGTLLGLIPHPSGRTRYAALA